MADDSKTPTGTAPPDWRGLCEELHLALERRAETLEEDRLLDRSAAALRAAMAQPEPEVAGPSDEELLELTEDWPATTGPRHDLSGCPEVPLYSVFADEVAEFARAVLARWGRPASAPAGEVAELVAWLRDHAHVLNPSARSKAHHIADLLERQAAPVPVAVSERLPGAEDCDAEGRCWVHQPHEACPESPAWELMSAKYASANYGAVCWLPAHALPLPSGEVEA